MKKFFSRSLSFFYKTVAMTLGWIFYDRKYLKGKYFSKYSYSLGWNWLMKDVFMQKILGYNKNVPFPVNPMVTVVHYENIEFDPDNINIFQKPGNYYQAAGAKIKIGRNCFIACNVGLITSNHDINDPEKHAVGKDITIGENCWIGLNSVILPGIVLGNNTTVGAGSIVTKSFPEGSCVIAGNPAKKIKDLRVKSNDL